MSFSDLVKRNLEQMEKTFDESLSGVHIYDEKLVCKKDRLLDGFLINWKGEIQQEFSFKYLSILTKKGYLAQKEYESSEFGLFTTDDKPIWKKDVAIHHEIYPSKTSFFTFTKEVHSYKGRDVEFDIILEYDYDGNELQRWSSWDNLKQLQKYHAKLELDSPKLPLLPDLAKRKDVSPWGGHYDYYRFNSFQRIPKNSLGEKDKRFAQGNWLVSARHGSFLFIISKITKKIVWSMSQKDVVDEIQGQHAVQLLEDGNMLIFDNGRYRGWSRIIEINPVTKKILFEYRSDDFYTQSRGYVQKLANGNYLITESEKGRVFEITSQKKIVWEYYHPKKQNDERYPENKGKREWIYRCMAINQ